MEGEGDYSTRKRIILFSSIPYKSPLKLRKGSLENKWCPGEKCTQVVENQQGKELVILKTPVRFLEMLLFVEQTRKFMLKFLIWIYGRSI